MPIDKRALTERERDILDSYSLKQITRNEAGKLLTELYRDYYDAQTTLNMIDEADKRAS